MGIHRVFKGSPIPCQEDEGITTVYDMVTKSPNDEGLVIKLIHSDLIQSEADRFCRDHGGHLEDFWDEQVFEWAKGLFHLEFPVPAMSKYVQYSGFHLMIGVWK